MTWPSATRTETRTVDICPRCGADVERCHFCAVAARHFVSPPWDHEGARELYLCDTHLVLLNVGEDGEFRGEVVEGLGSAQWEVGMYAPKDRCECDAW